MWRRYFHSFAGKDDFVRFSVKIDVFHGETFSKKLTGISEVHKSMYGFRPFSACGQADVTAE